MEEKKDVKVTFAGTELELGRWIRSDDTPEEAKKASLKAEEKVCAEFYAKAKELFGGPVKNQSQAFEVFKQLEEDTKKKLLEIALIWGMKSLHESDPVIIGGMTYEEAERAIESIGS